MLRFVALTGGPGGGKTTLIEEILGDPAWRGRVLALPEAIMVVGRAGVSAEDRLFQRMMVTVQCALENALQRALDAGDARLVLCHRGSLDPLAYWLDRGWQEMEFFLYTGITREEHYARYAAVVHLVTAADGAPEHYRRRPDAPRVEDQDAAVRLDALLQKAWGEHPQYYRIGNAGRDWGAKAAAARAVLKQFLV